MNAIFESTSNPLQQPEPRRYYGKYAGIVTKNTVADMKLADRKNHIGEIKVQVPGILEDGHKPIEVIAKPCFAPGFFFVPEVKSHVWVEFIAGDIDYPIWTGTWYPVKNVPQTFDKQDPNELQKIFRTATGHIIQLDSTEGDEKIVIYHKSATSITIDTDGNVKIEHKAGTSLEINDSELLITGDTKIDGKLTVGTSGPSTTIDGNQIKGG